MRHLRSIVDSGRFVISQQRRPQSGQDPTGLRSQNDIREGPSYALKLRSVEATEESLEPNCHAWGAGSSVRFGKRWLSALTGGGLPLIEK